MAIGYTPGVQLGFNAPKQEQYQTSMWAGFSPAQIKWLEEQAKGVQDEGEKIRIMQDAYTQALPIIKAKQQEVKRLGARNEIQNQVLEEKDPQKKAQVNLMLKVTDLANSVRSKVGQIQEKDDEIVNKLVNNIPNGEQLFMDYINGKSEELLYVSGLKDRPMTLGDTEGRNPLLRAGGALLQGVVGTIKGAYEGLVPGFGEMAADIRKITRDQTKSLPEKFNQILFGEIGMDYIGGAIGDTFGGALEGLYKGFATESERKLVNEKVKGIMEGIVKKEPVQNIMKKYNKLNPQEQQELNDLMGYAGNAMNFVGIGLGAKPAVQGAKAAGKVGIETLEQTAKLAPKMPGVSLKKLLPSAENTLQRMNRLTKGEQEKFKTMVGKEVGQWLNERGVVGTPGETIMELGERFSNTKGQVDEGLDAIRGTYKTEPLDLMLDDSVRYAENTRNPKLSRLQELQNKNSQGGLEMSEINEVKRFFEQNNKFNYGRDITAGEKTAWATNVDNELRNRQIDIAEKNGFANLKELNKETQAAKFIMDKLAKNESGRLGNNAITITDWIVAAPAMVDPSFLTLLLGKKIANSNWFAKNYVKIANRINGHKNIADKVADLVEIKKVQNEKQLQEFLNTPALPYKEGVDGGGNIDLNTIMVTPEGKSVRKGQILETNLNTNATSNMNDNINIGNTKVLGKKVKSQSESIPQLKAMVKAPEEPLIAEARKYKSAEEFEDAIQKNLLKRDIMSFEEYKKIKPETTLDRYNKIKKSEFSYMLEKDPEFMPGITQKELDNIVQTKFGWRDQLKQIREEANKKGLPTKTKNETIPQLKAMVKAPKEFIKEKTKKSNGQVLYHGTRKEFDEFIDGATREGGGYNALGKGIYLTDDILYAKNYANLGEGKVKRIIEAELKGKTLEFKDKIPKGVIEYIDKYIDKDRFVDLGINNSLKEMNLDNIGDLRNNLNFIGEDSILLDALENKGIIGFKDGSEYVIPRAKNVKIIGNKFLSTIGLGAGGGLFLSMLGTE